MNRIGGWELVLLLVLLVVAFALLERRARRRARARVEAGLPPRTRWLFGSAWTPQQRLRDHDPAAAQRLDEAVTGFPGAMPSPVRKPPDY